VAIENKNNMVRAITRSFTL